MKDYLIQCLFILLIAFSGCNNDEKRSCEARVSESAEVSISLIDTNLYPHLIRTGNQFGSGELVSILYDGDFTSSGSKNEIEIGNQSFGINEAFTLVPGEYEGVYRLDNCRKESVDGYYCECREEELEAEFTIQFLDTASIHIDSILLVENLECENIGAGCGTLITSIDVTNYSMNFTSDQLHEGIEFPYYFVSAPANSTVMISVYDNANEVLEYRFLSENTASWSEGWHSNIDNTMRIRVSRN